MERLARKRPGIRSTGPGMSPTSPIRLPVGSSGIAEKQGSGFATTPMAKRKLAQTGKGLEEKSKASRRGRPPGTDADGMLAPKRRLARRPLRPDQLPDAAAKDSWRSAGSPVRPSRHAWRVSISEDASATLNSSNRLPQASRDSRSSPAGASPSTSAAN